MNYLKKQDVENANLAVLPPEKREYVLALKDKLDLTYESTLTFGQEARKNLSNFSNAMLKETKRKDNPELDILLDELLTNIDKVDATTLTEKKVGFFDRFGGGKLKKFVAQYESVADVLDGIKERMHKAELELRKDIARCGEFEEQNLAYIEQLDYHIMAIGLKIKECRPILEQKLKDSQDNPDDILLANDAAGYENEINQMERKLLSLLQIREMAAQNVPKTRIIKDAEAVMVEQIQTSIDDIIPLWESELVIAIEITRLNGSVQMKKAVKQMTEKLTEANSIMVKNGAIEVAKQIEAGVIDTEVLKRNNDTIISMVKEIRKVKDDAKIQREKQIADLLEMQRELNQIALETSALTSNNYNSYSLTAKN